VRTIHLLRKLDPAEWGGTETAIQRLFEGLREQGVTPVAYCPRLENPPAREMLLQTGCEIRRFKGFVPALGMSAKRKRQLVAMGGNLMSFDLISALWREKDADIIHTHALGRIGGIARTIAKKRRIPFVVSIHGGVLDLPEKVRQSFQTADPGGFEWGKLFGLLFQSHRLFHDADAIITCNGKEASLLREAHPAKRIVVQPHGVPLPIYRRDHREAARAAFPQIRGSEVLLCVGRIDPIKNQGWLIDQAPAIFQRHPRALLVLAGACTDEPYGEEVALKIRRLGLQDRILLTGGLPPNDPRLIGLIQEAAALLLPSVSETFGLVILEAWAAGTISICSRASGPAALIQNGHNGWLFDLDAPEIFHHAVGQVLAYPDFAKEMAQRGAKVSEDYGLGALAARVKSLYEELIAAQRTCAT
jgi:glycosyltransferase involved in cell wall biosynthesis